MGDKTMLTADEVMAIPKQLMPMPVLSDSVQNLISAGIKAHTNGAYNHFMWLIEPGICASMQTNGYKLIKIASYFPEDRLKFWYNPEWTPEQRAKITKSIMNEINRPWYRNLYDFFAYTGQLFHCKWMHIPGWDICSDKMKHVMTVDNRYDLECPDPEDVNAWLKKTPPYLVYGRYTPD